MKQTFKFLLITLLISYIYSQDVPQVAIDDGFVVDYGDTFTINCSISATHQNTGVYWQKDSNGIVTRLKNGLAGTKGITIDNPSLTINFASMTDSGMYTCYAFTSFGLGKSKASNITVHGGLPAINTPQTNFTVIYGSFITMECMVTAFPKLKHVNWQRNISGILTILNDGAVGTGGISTNNPSLTLKYTNFADAGIYQCSASNAVGTERSDAMYLTVIGGIPIVTIPLANYSSDYGKEVTIECTVAAIPDVKKIFWEKSVNGEKSSINARTHGIKGSIVNNPSLIILNVTLTDSGYYTCFAENKVGTGMSRTTYLNVHGGIPDVRIRALVYNVIFGRKLYLHCDVTAKPKHTLVYWERKRNGIISTINSQAIGTTGITPNTPSLTLQFSTFLDMGTYTCLAANAIGIRQSHPTIVTVTGGPPVAIIQNKHYIANYGDTLTIQCNVMSIPTYTKLYWQRILEGSITNITAEYQGISGANLTNPSLTIEFVTTSDAGLYVCIAVNAIGIGKSSDSNVTVIAAIPFVFIEKNMQTAFVGLSFEIQCSIHSTPMYTYVYWTRSNNATTTVLIPGTVGYEGMTAPNPNLIIPKVDIFMSGEYRCLAINEVGTGTSLPTYLTVEYNNEVSTTNYETFHQKGTTGSSILSTSFQEDEPLGNEISTTKMQFSNVETKSTNGITTAEIYVTEAEGVDKSNNSSNMYTGDASGNNTGKVVGIAIGTLLCLAVVIVGLGLFYKCYLKEKCYRKDSKPIELDERLHSDPNQYSYGQSPRPLPSIGMQGEQVRRPRSRPRPSMGMQGKQVRRPRSQPRPSMGMQGEQEYQASKSSQSRSCQIGILIGLNQENSFRRDGRYSFRGCKKCKTLHRSEDSCSRNQ